MTVRFIPSEDCYFALSTDTFPTTSRDGRKLLETDTGVRRFFDIDTGSWFMPNLDVNVQDQVSMLVDFYMTNVVSAISLLTSTAIDDVAITLNPGHGVLVGEMVSLEEGGRMYQGLVQTVVGDIITLDSPLDFAYTTGATGSHGSHSMAVDGSITPVIFRVKPVDSRWDIVRLILHMEDTSTMDDGTFGGQAALTTGVLLRKKDGEYQNIFNVKTNGDLAARSYDREYVAKPPSGTGNAINIRRTFGGQSKNGVVIRLDSATNDELQIIISDNLTGLSSFHCIAQGHEVVD